MDQRPLQSLLPSSSSGSSSSTHKRDTVTTATTTTTTTTTTTSDRSARAGRLGRNKITRVGTACESCKRRRSKCSGPPAPCSLCSFRGNECTFDPSLDGRRAGQREDREALLVRNRLLTALLQAVRFRSSSEVETFIKCIRENGPDQNIFGTIQQCLQQFDEGEAAADNPLDVVCLNGDLHGEEPAHNISTPPSHDDGQSGTQLHDRPSDRICPTCNQPSLMVADALTPSESVREPPGLPAADEQHPQGSTLNGGKAPNAGKVVPKTGATPPSRRHSSISDVQHDRRGWHFSLCAPQRPSARPSRPPTDLLAEEGAPQTDAPYQRAAQQTHAGPIIDAGIALSIPRIGVDGPNTPGGSRKHVSPLYGIQTLVTQEKTPLSDIITGFMDSAKTLLTYGASLPGVLGSDRIEVELFFRDRTQEDGLTVSGWACELWRSFDDWDVYVRLAQILAYTTVMRWMLIPTAQSYAAIPAILKPRPIQYLVPHHIALDFLPLPPLRETLIKNLRDWMTALPAAALSVNWVRGMDEAVVWGEPSRRRLLSKDFMDHVTNYQNWSIGETILGTFPEVKGMIRLDRI